MADDAGALLVRSGLIAAEHLAAARSVCAQVGGTLGEHLVAAGLVSDDALTEFYRSRLLVPQVNPNSLARLPDSVIALVPPDMAVEFRVVPVAIDREGNLTVAMSDPSNRHAVDEMSFFTGKYVVRAVATQMQIAWCLAHYYDHITELATRLLRPAGAEGAAAPARAPAAGPPAGGPPPAAPARPMARSRGVTGRVEAARHRVLAPVTRPPLNEARPDDRLLDPAVARRRRRPRPPVLPRARPAVPAARPEATTLVPGEVDAGDVEAAAAEAQAAPEAAIDEAAVHDTTRMATPPAGIDAADGGGP